MHLKSLNNGILICTTRDCIINCWKFGLNWTYVFHRNSKDNIFNTNISKSCNSSKNHRMGTGLWYAQLSVVLIHPSNIHWNPTHTFREIEWTIFCIQIFSQNRIMIWTTRHGTYQFYKVLLKSDYGFWRNSADKIFNTKYSKSHNSDKNHWTGTG